MCGARANYLRFRVRDVMSDVTDAMRRDWVQNFVIVRDVKLLKNYNDILIFKMAACLHLGVLKMLIFIARRPLSH